MADQLRLLILEDQPTDALMLVHELQQNGFALDWERVETEEDYLARLDPALDLILADYTLPQFDALRALHLLQERGLDIPFIVITGTMSDEQAVEFMKQGAADYLLKDRLARLGHAVRRAIQEKQARDRQRRVEEALRESEERYRTLVESVDDNIHVKDCAGRYLFVNRAGARVLGRQEREIIGQSALEIYPGEAGQRILRGDLEVLETGTTLDVEEEIPVAAGTRFYHTRKVPLRDEAGAVIGVVTISRDVTERKLAERVLEFERQRLFSLLNELPAGVYLLAPDYSIRFANRYFRQHFGDPGRRPCFEVLHGRPEPCEECPAFRVFRTLIAEQAEWVRPDGQVYEVYDYPFCDVDGSTLVLEMLVDVTSRQRMEEALRESEEKYRTLFQNTDDSIVLHELAEDGMPGRFIEVNDATCRRLGYSREELLTKSPRDIRVPEQLAEVSAIGQEIRSRGQTTFEAVHRARDGRRIPVEISSHLFTLKGKRVVQAIARDISQRQALEEQLRRAQRLEMAGRIAGQVAHDFSNLLSPLAGYPELIKMRLPLDHPAIKYCDAMIEAAWQMAAINDDLLTLGRRGRFEPEPTDLNGLVQQAVAQMPRPRATLSIALDLAPDLLPTRGVSSQLLRVIANLLFNARDAMADAGHLRVSTTNVYVDRPLSRYNRIEVGEYVRLEVSDTGVGIPPENRDQIFDAFFSTKRSDAQRGSGLGLSIVQAIVGDHQGYVDLESEVGKGTTFSVYLPAERKVAEAAPGDDHRGGGETILVVDDDERQRKLVSVLLRTLSYRVEAVGSGQEAITFLGERPVDLLVLDMVMPGGLDGVETYRQALAARPGQRAILLSAYAGSEQVREAQALGAGAFLSRPVAMETLAQAVRAELDRT